MEDIEDVLHRDYLQAVWGNPSKYPQCSSTIDCKTLDKFLSTPNELLEAEKFIVAPEFSEQSIEDFLSTGITEPETIEDTRKKLLQFKKERRSQLLTLLSVTVEELQTLDEEINDLEK